MIKYDFRTTHYMVDRHFDEQINNATLIKEYKNINIDSILFFPGDIIIIKRVLDDKGYYSESCDLRLDPADIYVLKYLWDTASPTGRRVVRKHIQRCHKARQQYASGVEDDIATWWMSVWLGMA